MGVLKQLQGFKDFKSTFFTEFSHYYIAERSLTTSVTFTFTGSNCIRETNQTQTQKWDEIK